MTEAQLIDRVRRGDRSAARELYERHAPRVFAVVRRIAGDEESARDWAQETWLRAFRCLDSFRGEARFSTWIHRVAVNTALQSARVERRREATERPLPDILGEVVAPHDVLLERRLEAALDRVPRGMRRVLVLHDVEGHTHEEIGKLLGVSTGTSKSQLFKARARMRELLLGVWSDRAGADGSPSKHEEVGA